MGKWLSNLLTPLLILLATLVVTALMKGPIDEMANQGRLKAEVELAPWIDVAGVGKSIEKSNEAGGVIPSVLYSADSLTVARVRLLNESPKKVTNISFELPSYDKKTAVIISKDGKFDEIKYRNDIFTIPDMNPGDKFTIIVLGNFTTYNLTEKFKSFSSEGRFRTQFYWPDNQGFESQGQFSKILDSVIWIGGTASVVLLIIILGIAFSQHSEYIKMLMIHKRAYKLESDRFWSDPRKFTPDWNLVSEKHYKDHALFGVPSDKKTCVEDDLEKTEKES